MRITELAISADRLPKASEKAIAEYERKTAAMVAGVNSQMLARSDLKQLIGPNNVAMMTDNHSNHARFVASYLTAPDPNQLVETVSWVFKSYMSRGFHQNYWSAQLNCWITEMKNKLDEESYGEIYPLYEWFIINIPTFSEMVR